ncbi:MAG: hypothetical protein IPL39_22525 [Opitutaceae bacterium]|nr:hypothetical protein [Opitutaceae bacterium]
MTTFLPSIGCAFFLRAGAIGLSRRGRSIVAVVLGLFLGLTSSAKLGIEYQMVLGNPTGATADAGNHDHYLIQRSQYSVDYNDARRAQLGELEPQRFRLRQRCPD